MSSVLLEARPFRPFKSSEEYLYAMKEDLAEWFQTLYPHLRINVDNFLDRLETGVALCEHANAVKVQAAEYVQKKQARKIMTKSVTGSLAQAQALVRIADVKFFPTAKPGTFFARDNVCNFIQWCRQSLEIIECLLFESDDLIMRKNEKHVILCLLEVARRGAKFGMLAPMLVQMERQIDREIAADQRRLGVGLLEGTQEENGLDEDTDSELEDEQPVLMYGPLPQIVTNDLKSLDEMVRDLVEKCTCPTQFPMIRVSEGKYRIGDTKVLIFVRILRNHVMVRVGGGWDTLAHYLDKHDPCRCRSQHRTTQGAKLVNKPGAMNLVGAQVYYDRSPPRVSQHNTPNGLTATPNNQKDYLGPPMNSLNRSRSRSPSHLSHVDSRRSVSPNFPRKSLAPPERRSRSPTPNFVSTHMTKLSTNKSPKHQMYQQGPQSLPYIPTNVSPPSSTKSSNGRSPSHVSSLLVSENGKVLKSEASLHVSDNLTDHSDNASEVSDEGYRSLGIIQSDRTKNRVSLYSQNSFEDVDENEHHDSIDYNDDTNDCGLRRTQFSSRMYSENSSDSAQSPVKDQPISYLRRSASVEKAYAPEKPQNAPQKQRSFVRSASTERGAEKSNKSLPPSKKSTNNKNINNTWNGRQKSARPSLADAFSNGPSPSAFSRNSAGRRSLAVGNYDSNGRRVVNSNSANTSPTKGRLRQELLKTVKKNADDLAIAQEVQAILKKYDSLNILDDFSSGPSSIRSEPERGGYYSPRKESRPENHISRIPAPISHRV